jgi:glycosyltransferase involved in cell wall biosynthesis
MVGERSNMNSASIDVLLATYNGARYLRPQIESILNQEEVSFRILVRDDGSADETPAVIEHYRGSMPDRIIHLSGSGHLGAVANFAHLLRESKAPYAALSDQDDVWAPHKLRTLLTVMRDLESRHGVDTPLLVHSDLTVVDETLRERHHSFWRYSGFDPRGTNFPRLLIKNTVTGCASLANRALIELALPIPQVALVHDYWLALVAGAAGHLGIVEEPLMAYRQHARNAIGARPYDWTSFVGRLTGGLALWDIGALRRQAAALSERCHASIAPEYRTLIEDFVCLPGRNWIGRRRILLRHGILMPGLMRNLALLFCVRLRR